MPATTPSTEVFAFAPPAVKDGEAAIVVRVGGGLRGLHGSLSVWRGLYEHLFSVFGPITPAPLTGGRRLSPENLKKYLAVRGEWEAGSESLSTVCQRHGVRSSTFGAWLTKERKREAAEKAGASPLLKPNGRIL